MSAIIIPFPANPHHPAPTSTPRIADARWQAWPSAPSAASYMVGYMDGYLKNRAVAEKSPPRRVKA